MSNSILLSLFLVLLTVPAAGFFFFLNFIGFGVIAGFAATILILVQIWARERSQMLDQNIRFDLLLFCLATALALCLLGGEGRFFFANADWLIRDAIINDLVAWPWPFGYPIGEPHSGVQTFIFRAPLAMYMLPAVVGKVFGVYA